MSDSVGEPGVSEPGVGRSNGGGPRAGEPEASQVPAPSEPAAAWQPPPVSAHPLMPGAAPPAVGPWSQAGAAPHEPQPPLQPYGAQPYAAPPYATQPYGAPADFTVGPPAAGLHPPVPPIPTQDPATWPSIGVNVETGAHVGAWARQPPTE